MYDVRDLLGHFVRLPPRKNRDGMCPHACCKGKRPHPDRFPVLLPTGLLHSMSDEDLIAHFNKPGVGDNGKAVVQVTRELERREHRDHAREMKRINRSNKDEEYRLYLEGQWVAAEEATRGNMTNKKGRARGIDPRSLWTANDATRARYASEELRAYWDAHPIVTRREFGSAAAQASGGRRRTESRLYGVY